MVVMSLLISRLTIQMDDYGRNNEMQLKRLILAEFYIKIYLFMTALCPCPSRPSHATQIGDCCHGPRLTIVVPHYQYFIIVILQWII
jgi:hypothetical protein